MKLNARWSLLFYPVFKDEKSNGSDEKSVKRKSAKTKTNRTNIIATSFLFATIYYHFHLNLVLACCGPPVSLRILSGSLTVYFVM